MEKFLVRKKIVSCQRNAKALLGLFAVMCFTLSAYIISENFLEVEKPAYFSNSEINILP